MRKSLVATVALATALAGCGGGRGRAGPDEFQVARRAPLTIPPDFALVPPKPGAPRPQEADSSQQTLQALFGGAAQRSPEETTVVDQAGRTAEPGIRSDVGATDPAVVNKGATTRDILAAPVGAGQDAQASTPQ